MSKPVVVLVHGAFAESSSWNGVIERLTAAGVTAVAAANPLRSLHTDADYVKDVVASLGNPAVLVGHSYGGQVITQAATEDPAVRGLVYVSAFARRSARARWPCPTGSPAARSAAPSYPAR